MIWLALAVLLVLLDQLTKWLVTVFLQPVGSAAFIPRILRLTYVENRGIAFGMFQNMQFLFIPLALLVVAGCCLLLRRYLQKKQNMPVLALTMIVSGAAGNLIDKCVRGYVVDFLETAFMEFPVFNVADICVCCGAVLFAVFILFFDKEEKHENHL